jgi:hypothetical protein
MMMSIVVTLENNKTKNQSHYLGILGEYFGQIIVQSFDKGYLLSVKQWLQGQRSGELSFLKKYLSEGYREVIDQEHLLSSMSTMDKTVLIQSVKDTLFLTGKGVFYESKCRVCGR